VAEYCDLRNINEAMMDFADGDDSVDEILMKITEQDKLYIREQLEAGADIIGVGDAACSLLGPALYAKYGFPYEKIMIDTIHKYGGLAKLHICGNIGPLIPKIAELGADIVDVDWMVDFEYAAKTLKGISSVNGNFDPVSVILSGTPESIRDAVLHCLKVGGDRCLISAGCEVPRDTPVENLMAVAETLKSC
jgi:uroporphyrinogen-III decarboxylase